MKTENRQSLDDAISIIQKVTIRYQPFFTQDNVRALENLMTAFRSYEGVIKRCEKREEEENEDQG